MKNLLLNFLYKIPQRLGVISTLSLALSGFNVFAQTADQYNFTAVSGTFTPLVSPSNSSLGATADDNISNNITIGFPFTFEGIIYTQLRVSSNGQLLFGTTGDDNNGNDLATSDPTYRPGVAPLWDDIQCTAGVKYKLTGTSPNQVFTAEWLNMEWNYGSGTPVISFQVKLYQGSNNIEIIYRQESTAVNSGDASIGIMGVSSTSFISLQNTDAAPVISTTSSMDYLSTKPATGQIYRFSPPPVCTGTPVGGVASLTTIPGCGSGDFELSATAPFEIGTKYQWQSSPDNSFWTDILNDTLPGLSAAPLSSATYFRRNTTCTSTTLTGSSSSVLVKPVYGGQAEATPAVCGDSITLSSRDQSASITTYQWLESTDSIIWTPIVGAVSGDQKVPSPIVKTYYRVYVTCTSSSSFDTSFTVTVNPVSGGTAEIVSSFCLDSTELSLSNASSGETLTYNWLQSTDSITWTSMGIATESAKFPSPTSALYYRSVVGCGSSFDSSGVIKVSEPCQGFAYSITRNSSHVYNSIQSTGNEFTWDDGFSYDDDRTLPVLFPAGFNFTYNGEVRPALYACINGWLSLDTTSFSDAYSNDLSTTSPKAILAPFWEDLVTLNEDEANTSYIKYEVQGTAPNRVMVVEWAEMERISYPAPTLNFQVRLYEGSNNIEYAYGRMQPFDGTGSGQFSYSLGMTGNDNTAGQRLSLQLPNTTNFSSALINNELTIIPSCNSSYLFTAGGTFNPSSISPIPANDSSGAPVLLTVNPTPCTEACGTYYTSLNATPSGTAIAPVSGDPDDDVWFSFVAPASGEVNISIVASSDYDPAFQVMTSLFDTTGLGGAGSRDSLTGPLESVIASGLIGSNTYLIRVFNSGSGSGSTSGAFSICVNEIIPPPINDDTTNAILLNVQRTCSQTAGTTLGATASPQSVCGGLADDDVWYKFKGSAYADTITVISNSTFRPHVEILTESMNSLSCINAQKNADTVITVLTGLSLDSTYFVRIYHTNAGTASALFTICITGDSATEPKINTAPSTNVFDVIADLGGNILSEGGFQITRSGVVFSTSANPVVGGPGVIDSTTTPVISSGAFTTPVTGLIPSTTYHYRAYAENILGVGYGGDSTFTTAALPSPAILQIIAASNIDASEVTVGGTILSNGGSVLSASGIVYGTSSNPTLGSSAVDSTTTPLVSNGSFSFNLQGLTPATKYYFRAYGINAAGNSYSVQDSFVTTPVISVLPYTEDFDAATTVWQTRAINGGTNSWVRGTPTKTFLNGAYSGTNAFVTKLSGDYDGTEDCVLYSPQFDFTTQTTDPVLRFRHRLDTDYDPNYDGGVVEISINGSLWTRLDAVTGTDANYNTSGSYAWYDNGAANGALGVSKFSGLSSDYASQTGGWIESATRLTGTAGQSNVKFRFRFWADSDVDEGWEIDNIEVVAITTPSTPASAVILSGATGSTTDVSWTKGNGTGRLVVARLTTAPAVAPANNTLYEAASTLGILDSTGLGNYIVYADSGNAFTATGLTEFTDYTYDVYEYNGKYMHISFAPAASNNATTLPVRFTSFLATVNRNNTLLNWTTASEINNNGFEVERSLNGKDFKAITFVKGAGNSSLPLSYSFVDADAFNNAKVLYYRLKQIDFNGKYTYSQTVRVMVNSQNFNSVTVNPNPFTSDYTVSFNAVNAGNATVELADMQGRLISHHTLQVMEGDNKITLDNASHANSGIYFVRITLNGETQVMKLVKN